MERALVLCVILSACGTRSGIFCCVSPCVECALVFCIILFHMWSTLWFFVLYVSACVMRSGIVCYIFLNVEHTLVFCVLFFHVCSALCYFLFYFSACGMRSCFSLNFFPLVWNYIWIIHTCKQKKTNLSCIFLLYFFVLYFFVLYYLCFFSCCIFSFYIFLAIFSCCIFCVIFFCFVLKTFHSLSQTLVLYVCQIFVQTLKKKASLGVVKLGLIHYLVIFLK